MRARGREKRRVVGGTVVVEWLGWKGCGIVVGAGIWEEALGWNGGGGDGEAYHRRGGGVRS